MTHCFIPFDIPFINSTDDSACRCADVITARCPPGQCALIGSGCNPQTPVGPCMASPEGPCRAWHQLTAGA